MMIDIVIPVYNTPIDDLKDCISSILSQTSDDWKCVIVDDGSTDEKTIDYLRKLSEIDRRIQVFFTSNHGPSHARNFALKNCPHDYIAFCDSDDLLEKQFIEKCGKFIELYKPELIMGGIKEEIKADEFALKTPGFHEKLYDSSSIPDLSDYLLATKTTRVTAELGSLLIGRIYGKVYSKSILEDCLFEDDLRIHEDNLFVLKLLQRCHRILITDEILYTYRYQIYSITKNFNSAASIEQELIFAKKLFALNDIYHFIDMGDGFMIRQMITLNRIINVARMLKISKSEKWNYVQSYFNIFEENHSSFVFNNVDDYNITKIKKISARILSLKSTFMRNSFLKLKLYL